MNHISSASNNHSYSFQDMLAEGAIHEAIDLRLDVLEDDAKAFRLEMETAKASSGVLTLAGLLLSANPLMAILAGAGALAYGYTLFKDKQVSGKLCPVPCVRKGITELFEVAGGNDEGSQQDPLENVLPYLEPADSHEYELLAVSSHAIAAMLSKVDSSARMSAYKFLLRQTRLRNSLQLPSFQELKNALGGVKQTQARSLPQGFEAPPVPVSQDNFDSVEDYIDAIPVTAHQVQDSPYDDIAASAIAPNVSEMIASSPWLLSRIIVGGSRTGKSFFVAMTVRKLIERYKAEGKKLTIWVISGAKRDDEQWYWECCDRVAAIDMASESMSNIRNAYTHWCDVLDAFNRIASSQNEPKMLIVDEAAMIASTSEEISHDKAVEFWKCIKLKLTHLSSAGAATGQAMWMISPNAAMGSLKLTRADVGAVNPVFIGYLPQWNEQVYMGATQNGLAPKNAPTDIEKREAIAAGCERMVAMEGRWFQYPHFDVPASAPRQQPQQQTINVEPTAQTEEKPQASTEDVAAKLLQWMQGTGQKYASNGAIPAKLIKEHFRLCLNGENRRITADEGNRAIALLKRQGAIETANGAVVVKGVEVVEAIF